MPRANDPRHSPNANQAWLFYRWLLRLFSPVLGLLTLYEAINRRGGWRYVRQRLGIYSKAVAWSDPLLWIHCASVGEVRTVTALADTALKQGETLLMTTHTPSGREALLSWRNSHPLADKITHAYLPLDYPSCVRRFLHHFHPKQAWVVESEIWPHLFCAMAERGPIHLINARLSQRTYHKLTTEIVPRPNWFWQRVRQLYRETFQCLTQVLAKNPTEASRFVTLGVDSKNVQVPGNLKLANVQTHPVYARLTQRPYVLLASSHDDEEYQVARRWLQQNPSQLLVIVPRHPERRRALLKQLRSLTNKLTQASRNETPTPDTRLHLADTFGQLMPWFAHAQVVIMGGSFAPKGGHNLLEPASLGACLITGPDMRDFEPETRALLDADGLKQCQDYDQLMTTLSALMANPDTRRKMGQNAKKWLEANQTVLERYIAHLFPLNTRRRGRWGQSSK
ncbi:3-deoxy-D-manno-octulosonic acid transferase [Thiomicrospira sp. WB1]|uniref:3-deoxy-D-manno-octulosonic acid transferase n=1 Tax=Thiomicrospira sp. WB1 TaxID=1685380 RepID=UPI0007481A03|nr:3-deoxy-D-manno-octulosonic acid transferase [Thiomicrospira sp. WB1]KUJ72411.1 hypothetical protein AVO41_00925 [Thiomicrospira sp. WB1]